MRNIRHILLISLLPSLSSCIKNNTMTAVLDRADSLIQAGQADSAYTLIMSFAGLKEECTEEQQMEYEMFKTKTMDEAGIRFTTDSMIYKVNYYYENEHYEDIDNNTGMFMRYLLGCARRDTGDKPGALNIYLEALNMADTTRSDCDYATLSRIYGQMALLCHDLRYPGNELKYGRQAMAAAKRANDTLLYLQAYGRVAGAYYIKKDYDSVMIVGSEIAGLYAKHGYRSDAADVYPMMISILLDRGRYGEAKRYMDVFEKSDAFDAGDIRNGHELYYDLKARYYHGTGNSDSAFHYFYRLAGVRDDIRCTAAAARGLMRLYHEAGATDSVLKYSNLYGMMTDSADAMKGSADMEKWEAAYNYYTDTNDLVRDSAEIILYIFAFICCMLAISAVCYIWFLVYTEKTNAKKLTAEAKKFTDLFSKFGNVKKTQLKSKAELEKLRKEIDEYARNYEELMNRYRKAVEQDADTELTPDNIRMKMRGVLSECLLSDKPAPVKELENMRRRIETIFPELSRTINAAGDKLTPREVYICMLIKLDFYPSEVVLMLGITSQNLTNIRSGINSKLFGESGAKTIDANIKRLN